MVIILCLLTVAAFLIIDYFSISRKKATKEELVPQHITSRSTVERFFHPGHSWAQIQKADLVTIGIDDFAQRFIGRVEHVEIPSKGSVIRQGEALATLRHGEKSLIYAAPISGIVIEVNRNLKARPEEINNSPLERGWLLKLSPTNLKTEIHNLFTGSAAARWQSAVQSQLIQLFSHSPAVVLQDGGELINNISDLVDDKEWASIAKEFFPLYSSNDQAITEPKEASL